MKYVEKWSLFKNDLGNVLICFVCKTQSDTFMFCIHCNLHFCCKGNSEKSSQETLAYPWSVVRVQQVGGIRRSREDLRRRNAQAAHNCGYHYCKIIGNWVQASQENQTGNLGLGVLAKKKCPAPRLCA